MCGPSVLLGVSKFLHDPEMGTYPWSVAVPYLQGLLKQISRV